MSSNTSSSLSPVVQVTKTETTTTKVAEKAPACGNKLPMGEMAKEAIIWFILIFALVWIILYSFNWPLVREVESGETSPAPGAGPDAIKCLIGALIIALIVVLFVWIFRSCSKY